MHEFMSRLAIVAALLLTPALTAQSVTTIFTGGNSGTTTWTVQFDITVLNPAGLWITAFDVNCENTRAGGVGSPFTLGVWSTAPGGTYVGNESNPSAWTLRSQGQGISRLLSTPTPVDVPDFFLTPGRHGVALEYTGTAMAYTNGNGANQRFANNDLQLDLGAASTGLFGTPIYTPRVWNGTVYYYAGNATWRSFGTGCVGTNGTPVMSAAAGSLPRYGTTLLIDLAQTPLIAGPVIMVLGVSSQTYAGLTLPLDLQPIGAPGCLLHTSIESTFPGVGVGGTGLASLSIPNDQSLFRGRLLLQALVLDASANSFGATLSNAAEIYVGR